MNKYAILIGIAGGTGSGKTSVAKAIAGDFGKSEVILIEQDSYYRDLSDLTLEERADVNFDHPNALDYKLMKQHINELIHGNSVNIPVYDYGTHKRMKKMQTIEKHIKTGTLEIPKSKSIHTNLITGWGSLEAI